MTFFSEKMSIFAANISDDLSLVVDQVFRIFADFPDLYIVRCRDVVHDPFLTTKTPFFYYFHTFAHTRQHYFSKCWGTNAWPPPPPQTLGDRPPSPPRFTPLISRIKKFML